MPIVLKSIIFIRFIFFVYALINLSPPLRATDYFAKESEYQYKLKKSSLFKKVFPTNTKTFQKNSFQIFKDNFIKKSEEKNLINNFSPLYLASFINNKKELSIQSEIQSEANNILNAEGNVIVSFQGNILKSDSLIYDKTNKTIIAKGNVSLNIGEQIFKMGRLEYDFNNKKGNLIKVKGLIKTDKLIDDLFTNFESSSINKTEFAYYIKKQKVLNTPDKVQNWIFTTDKIEIDGDKLKSKKALFTNDLLESNQVKIVINSLEAFSTKEDLKFKSSINYLILDEKVSIPFWLGNRSITKSGEYLDSSNTWSIGYDNLDKDGFFISRKINSINLIDDFVLDLEPQFLMQRALNGSTKSFVERKDSITGDKVKRDTSFSDYFALQSEIEGKISNWDLKIEKQINSFDADKFLNAFRLKTELSKKINFLNAQWDKSIYGVYRERFWNGSLGEAEIYAGYGSKLEKQNTWEVNGINKTEVFSLGLANLKGEELNSKNLVTSIKGNLFYSLDQKIPINVDNPKNKFIDSSFNYIFEPITKGLSLNTKIEASYSLYENENHQEYVGFGIGPEFILGDFKNNTFDYTRISIFPFYKVKSGDSIFKFDQISDKFILDISFDQQLFGPLILKSNGILNLDNDSEDYGEFINSKISLNWKKRSFEFGIFYQPHNKAGGINFTLFGFE